MDIILAQLQVLNKNHIQENQNTSKESDIGASRSENEDKDGNSTKDKKEDIGFHFNSEIITANLSKDKDKVWEDNQIKLDFLANKNMLQKVEIMCPYPP